jgi:hypothetical protein
LALPAGKRDVAAKVLRDVKVPKAAAAVHSLSEAAYERAFDAFVRSITEDHSDFHQISYYETQEK